MLCNGECRIYLYILNRLLLGCKKNKGIAHWSKPHVERRCCIDLRLLVATCNKHGSVSATPNPSCADWVEFIQVSFLVYKLNFPTAGASGICRGDVALMEKPGT